MKRSMAIAMDRCFSELHARTRAGLHEDLGTRTWTQDTRVTNGHATDGEALVRSFITRHTALAREPLL